MRTTDSGLYQLQIYYDYGVSHMTFRVTVYDFIDPVLSPGAKVGIVVVVLLLVFSAAVAGLIYYRRKTFEIKRQKHEEMTIFGVEGKTVTLNPDTEIQKDELIVWMFGDQDNLIAQLTVRSRETFDGPDGRFRDRLKLDEKTGSLTIRNIKSEHTGHYKLQISSCSRGTKYKKFKVITHGSTENGVNESATVQMPLLSVEEVDESSVQFKTRPQVPIAETTSTFE